MEMKIIKCGCSQENQLVCIEGIWRYDAARHGNGEPANGKCFNCFMPLAGMQPKEPVDEPAEKEQTAPDETDLTKLKKNDLVEYAHDLGIDVPAKCTKAKIIEMIEQLREQQAELK